MIDLHVMSRKYTLTLWKFIYIHICHASFCSVINNRNHISFTCAVFLLSFVLCVYDIVYQIFNIMLTCSLTVVKVWISLPLDEKINVKHFLCNLYKLKWKFGAAQEIWVLIAHGKCILNHPYRCSGDSVLKFGLCLHLHTYFVYKSSKGYVVSKYTFYRIACPFIAQHWVMNQNQMCLLIWFIIFLLFIINLVCFETCKGWIGCNFCMNDYVLIWHAKYQNDFMWTKCHA